MKKLLCLLLAAFLFLSGSAALAEDVNIVASFYPVYIFAQNILQDVAGVSLSCMTAPSTGCLHDYQLLTGDMRLLSRADVLLINGAGMEGFLPAVTAQLPHLQVVDASRGIPLLCSEGDHHHDHDHQHEHGEENAHIWLDPQNAIHMVENMARELARLLPEHSHLIQQNAAAYQEKLLTLHNTLQTALAPYRGRSIVTFHDSFPYFAHAYGLEIAAVAALDPEEPLAPRAMLDIIETVAHAENPPLFAEPQYKNAALELISRETGAPVYLLDPMVTGASAPDAYETVMLQNLETLLSAFSE